MIRSVAIVAMGGSCSQYMNAVKQAGGRKALADETWVINALGDVFAHDRVFHMDDVLVQEARAEAGNKHIGAMLSWLKNHEGPIYTSAVRDGYPGLVAFPLNEVLKSTGTMDWPYFNSTAAYPIAFAIHMGVKKISLYGMDFTYANRGHAEEGRACVEWWCRAAKDRGIEVRVASQSTLLDTCRPLSHRLYGYDGFDATVTPDGIALAPKELPSALEIEERYTEAHRA